MMHSSGRENSFHQPFWRRVKFGLRDAACVALLPLAKLASQHRSYLPILSYHRVLPNFPAGSPRSGSVSPGNFKTQMRYLSKNGYTSLSLEKFLSIAKGASAMPARPVMVTFDDGYADNITAHRIAVAHGITVNFFLPTGIIGQRQWPYTWAKRTPQEEAHMASHPQLWRPLAWDEVKTMEIEGAHFGCHGYLHRKLSLLAQEELDAEISQSVAGFEEHMGRAALFFSIPWGDGTAYTPAVVQALHAHGIEIIFTTHPRRTPLPVEGRVFPRISIREHDDLHSFSRKLEGAHDLLHAIMSQCRGRS